MEGNPKQSWILDSTLWTPDSRYWIPNFPTLNKISLMKTKILVLKDVNSKISDSLLNRAAVSFWQLTSLTRNQRKKASKSHLPFARKLRPLDPPSLRNFSCPPWEGYGYFLELHSGFKALGFPIPQAKFAGFRNPLHVPYFLHKLTRFFVKKKKKSQRLQIDVRILLFPNFAQHIN